MEHQRAQENTKKEFETKETEFKEREDDYAKQIAQIESEREEAKAEARRQTEASLAIIRSGGVPHGTSFAWLGIYDSIIITRLKVCHWKEIINDKK